MKLTNKSGGLNPQPAEELSERLNVLLANYQLFLQNIRTLYWNPQLRIFMDFGVALGRLRKIIQQDSEVIANSILLLGHVPNSSAMEFLSKADLTPAHELTQLDEASKLIINNSSQLLDHLDELEIFLDELDNEPAFELLEQLKERLSYAVVYFTQLRSTYMN